MYDRSIHSNTKTNSIETGEQKFAMSYACNTEVIHVSRPLNDLGVINIL